MKFNDIEEAMRVAEGNIKHEGMFITEEERNLVRLRAKDSISHEEFVQKVIELHKPSAK